jgi:peroxiredoxin
MQIHHTGKLSWFAAVLLSGFIAASSAWGTTTELKDFNDKPSSIADYAGKGKWLVVMLWASDCMVCNDEIGNYTAFQTKHAGQNVEMLGVSIDGTAKKDDAKDFISRHKVNFPSLIGEPEQVASMYKKLTGTEWIGTPTFMVYDPKGKLIGAQTGAVPTDVIESFIKRETPAQKN